MPAFDYLVKIVFFTALVSLAGSGFSRIIPDFSQVTCKQIHQELQTLHRITTADAAFSDTNAIPDGTTLFTERNCEISPALTLIKLRSYGVMKQIFLPAILLALTAF